MLGTGDGDLLFHADFSLWLIPSCVRGPGRSGDRCDRDVGPHPAIPVQAGLGRIKPCVPGCPVDPSTDQAAGLSAILHRLSQIHRRLDKKIQRETKRCAPDAFRPMRLNKLRDARLHLWRDSPSRQGRKYHCYARRSGEPGADLQWTTHRSRAVGGIVLDSVERKPMHPARLLT